MQRVKLLYDQISNTKCKNEFRPQAGIKKLPTAYNYLKLDDFLNEEEIKFKNRLKSVLDEIRPQLKAYNDIERTPVQLIKLLIGEFPNLHSMHLKGHNQFLNFSPNLSFIVDLQLAYCDPSFSIANIHQSYLVMNTILTYGTSEQKEYYLPKLLNWEIIGSFNITEPDFGSDAASIQTRAELINDNFVISGIKRWGINSYIATLLLVWAQYNGELSCFLVDVNQESKRNLQYRRIENKLSLKSLEISEITLDRVIISKDKKLNIQGFKEAAKIISFERLGLGIRSTGALMRAYDLTLDYVSRRKQFGKSLSSFQIIQERLVISMANIQAMIYLCKRVWDLKFQGKSTPEMDSLVKVFCTRRSRIVIRLLREIWGGNGMIYDNEIIKILNDLESFHTFGGTWDINVLVLGKDLTGINAVK